MHVAVNRGTVTSYCMDEFQLDIMLCAAHMRFNASWRALVRSESDVTRERYRYEIARMNRLLVARQAPGITSRTLTDQLRHSARQPTFAISGRSASPSLRVA